jgi:hypothetical protein
MKATARCTGGQVERGRVWAGVHFDGAGRPTKLYREVTITTRTCGWSGPWRRRATCPDCGGNIEVVPGRRPT